MAKAISRYQARRQFNKSENLKNVNEGFKFKWKNGVISVLINETDNSLIKKISRN
jgi:hypothetical protein